MTLREQQSVFVKNKGLLIAYVYSMGYELSDGEAKRSDEQAEINALGKTGREAVCQLIEGAFPALARKIRNNTGNGIRNSVHELGLAQDYNLFKDGVYLEGTEAHRQFGEYWEKLHPLNRWGGRWGDGNHYSMEYNGRK